ncbi:MAG: DNA replication and repair protein RecF, partial [Zavarzinia sp.]
AGVQGTGPHRGDMTARHVAKDLPASHCSTGEQKALLISIVLAQGALVAMAEGRAPILLLDEVAAHIDPGRRQMLYDLISGRGLQAFLTGTERSLFHGLEDRGQFFDVRDGQAVAAS